MFLPRREIPLVTRDGRQIPNSIEPDPGKNAVELALRSVNPLVLAQASQLAPPSGRYNCHGLVFASRRTNIPPVDVEFSVDELLARDGYRKVSSPRVGDVVAYRDARGEICHRADQTPYSNVIEFWRLQ